VGDNAVVVHLCDPSYTCSLLKHLQTTGGNALAPTHAEQSGGVFGFPLPVRGVFGFPHPIRGVFGFPHPIRHNGGPWFPVPQGTRGVLGFPHPVRQDGGGNLFMSTVTMTMTITITVR